MQSQHERGVGERQGRRGAREWRVQAPVSLVGCVARCAAKRAVGNAHGTVPVSWPPIVESMGDDDAAHYAPLCNKLPPR